MRWRWKARRGGEKRGARVTMMWREDEERVEEVVRRCFERRQVLKVERDVGAAALGVEPGCRTLTLTGRRAHAAATATTERYAQGAGAAR